MTVHSMNRLPNQDNAIWANALDSAVQGWEDITQAGAFLQPDCAPSSERPQFADLWSESAERCGRNSYISGSAHLCR